MTEFKQDDVVSTRVNRESHDGEMTIGRGSLGKITVVGVDLDGTTNGIEVLFEDKTYGVYYDSELELVNKIFIPESYTLTKENYVEVAEWCGPDTKIAKPWSQRPRLLVKTGFSEDPSFRVTVEIGDKLEKTKDGKIQIWVRQDNVAWDEDPPSSRAARFEPESRPAELKKFRTGNPLAAAIALVNALYYDGKLSDGDVYIVWFCSTLQNWKALVSTNVKDNSYYEVTHNGDKKETYVDRYVKVMNQHFRIPDDYLED